MSAGPPAEGGGESEEPEADQAEDDEHGEGGDDFSLELRDGQRHGAENGGEGAGLETEGLGAGEELGEERFGADVGPGDVAGNADE